MKPYSQVAFYLYSFVLLVMGLAGLVYASTNSFMPYHADVIGQNWQELTPEVQLLINSSLNTAGYFIIIQTLSLLTVLFTHFRLGATWASPAIFIIVIMNLIAVLYVAIKIDIYTPANPPWFALVILITISFIAFVISWRHQINKLAIK